MSLTSLPDKVWYQANCHCGQVRYRVFLPQLFAVDSKGNKHNNASTTASAHPHRVMSCNCSLCTRNGYLNVYPTRTEIKVSPPGAPGGEVAPGSKTLKASSLQLGYYRVQQNEHVFCLVCGSSLWVDAFGGQEGFNNRDKAEDKQDIVAVNVRMLKDLNVEDLTLRHFDGRNFGKPYEI